MLKKNDALNHKTEEQEVSVVTNLIRTFSLVGMTVFFMSLVRFFPLLSHIMQHIAAMGWWQQLYGFFNIETALGREQLLLIAITFVCFVAALSLQLLGLFLFKKMRFHFCADCRKEGE